MARPSKSVDMMDQKTTHHPKAEFEARAEWEEALTSDGGMVMSADVKADPYARELFRRTKKTFKSVNMDDAFYGEGLNTYCLIRSEIRKRLKEREELIAGAACLDDVMPIAIKLDASVAKLRDQAFAWEKENLHTVQAKLRAIPKKPQKDGDDDKVVGVEAFMRRIK